MPACCCARAPRADARPPGAAAGGRGRRAAPWRAADVPDSCSRSRPRGQRFSWPGTEPYTADDAHAFYAAQEPERLAGIELQLALTAPGDASTLLGGASLHIWSRTDGIASVGYWLAAEARGRGVATHAVRLVAAWGFATLGIARLELTSAPDNRGLAARRRALRLHARGAAAIAPAVQGRAARHGALQAPARRLRSWISRRRRRGRRARRRRRRARPRWRPSGRWSGARPPRRSSCRRAARRSRRCARSACCG